MLMLLCVLGDPATHAENMRRVECDPRWPPQLAWMRCVVVTRACPPPVFATLQKCVLRPDLVDFVRAVAHHFVCTYENPVNAASLIEEHMQRPIRVLTRLEHEWLFAACGEAEVAVFPSKRSCPNTIVYCLGGVRVNKVNHALLLLMGLYWGQSRPLFAEPLRRALGACQAAETWPEIGAGIQRWGAGIDMVDTSA